MTLNLKRISAEWQKAYGRPVVLAETFIDHSRFNGTSCKAAGWTALGKTKGFGRNAGRYYHHSNLRTIFIKPIKKDASKLLSSPFLNP